MSWFLQKIVDFILSIIVKLIKSKLKLEEQGMVKAIEYIEKLHKDIDALKTALEKEKKELHENINKLQEENRLLDEEKNKYREEAMKSLKMMKEMNAQLRSLL